MSKSQLKYPVTLRESGTGRAVFTFTWARTYKGAVARVGRLVEDQPDVWEGWSFEVTPTPAVR